MTQKKSLTDVKEAPQHEYLNKVMTSHILNYIIKFVTSHTELYYNQGYDLICEYTKRR